MVDPRMTEGGDGHVQMEDVVRCLIRDVRDRVERGWPWKDAAQQFLSETLIHQLEELEEENPCIFASKGIENCLRIVLDGAVKGRQVPEYLDQVPPDGSWADVTITEAGGFSVTFTTCRIQYSGLQRSLEGRTPRPTAKEFQAVRDAVAEIEAELGVGRYKLFFHGTKAHDGPSVLAEIMMTCMSPFRQFGDGLGTFDDATVAADWAAYGSRWGGVPAVVVFAVRVPLDEGEGTEEGEEEEEGEKWGHAWARLNCPENHLRFDDATDDWKRCVWAHVHESRFGPRREYSPYGLVSGPLCHNHARIAEADAKPAEATPEWWPPRRTRAAQSQLAMQFVFRNPAERPSGIALLMSPETIKGVIIMGDETRGGDSAEYHGRRYVGADEGLRRLFDPAGGGGGGGGGRKRRRGEN